MVVCKKFTKYFGKNVKKAQLFMSSFARILCYYYKKY